MSVISQTEVGWLPEQKLHDITQSLPLDEFGEPTQTAVPLIKEPQPALQDGEKAESYLEWDADKVTRKWNVVTMVNPELYYYRQKKYSDVKAWRLRVWMARNGINPSSVAALIESLIPEGAARQEALARWEYSDVIPRDHDLVGMLGAQLGLTSAQLDLAWLEMHQI